MGGAENYVVRFRCRNGRVLEGQLADVTLVRRDGELFELFGVLDTCVHVLTAILVDILARQIGNVTVLHLLKELVRLNLSLRNFPQHAFKVICHTQNDLCVEWPDELVRTEGCQKSHQVDNRTAAVVSDIRCHELYPLGSSAARISCGYALEFVEPEVEAMNVDAADIIVL